MDVFDITVEYLEKNKFDGLQSGCGECACKIGDLAPCGELRGDCEPGYLVASECREHDFHIGPKGTKPICFS
jgi:hypothetical protein